MRSIISLGIATFIVLSSTFTASAKPIHFSNNKNNNNNNGPSKDYKQQHKLLNRLTSSWMVLASSPLRSLHAITGSPSYPTSHSHDISHQGPKKLFQKRSFGDPRNNDKNKLTETSGSEKECNKDSQKKPISKTTVRAKNIYSAYEAIVNSDSQLPNFLTQHRRLSKAKIASTTKVKEKQTSAAILLAASTDSQRVEDEETKMLGRRTVTSIDILRQTGSKKLMVAPVFPAPVGPLPIEPDKTNKDKEKDTKKRPKPEIDDISPSTVKKAKNEGITPVKNQNQQTKAKKDIIANKTIAKRARDAITAIMEGGPSAAKALLDIILLHGQQHSLLSGSSGAGASAASDFAEGKTNDSKDFKVIVDNEGAVDLPVITNNIQDGTTPSKEPATNQNSEVTIINDNEYLVESVINEAPYAYTYPKPYSEYSDTQDEWRLSDDDDYMAQYVHRRPDSFPGSESVFFTGTVLQRTIASSVLLLAGFVLLLGIISYKMFARRRDTSPWAFLHYMTVGIFTSPFYDSDRISNSTLHAYTSTSTSTPSINKNTSASNPVWLRRSSLQPKNNHNHGHNSILSSMAEKEPLLPEPVVASSATSSFKKAGGSQRGELRRTSAAQHHQAQIEIALHQELQQQPELDYLQKAFMRRTSI
ncbi:hypothetical protein FBU30_006285 [Linnemannia zychae]|nr:hypothetical protein FBU30_006285 [Linnemannia zychae]